MRIGEFGMETVPRTCGLDGWPGPRRDGLRGANAYESERWRCSGSDMVAVTERRVCCLECCCEEGSQESKRVSNFAVEGERAGDGVESSLL